MLNFRGGFRTPKGSLPRRYYNPTHYLLYVHVRVCGSFERTYMHTFGPQDQTPHEKDLYGTEAILPGSYYRPSNFFTITMPLVTRHRGSGALLPKSSRTDAAETRYTFPYLQHPFSNGHKYSCMQFFRFPERIKNRSLSKT